MTAERIETIAAERYVIGALLADPRVLRGVQEECIPKDFSDMRLGDIYRGIIGMVAGRDPEPVDYLTVSDRLIEWGVRGIDLQELAKWATSVPAASSAPFYARIVREAALRRSLQQIGGGLLAAEDPSLALASAIDSLRELRDRDAASSAGEVKWLREVLDVPEDADSYDWVIPGLIETRDRLMLTGSEGGGKSTFLRQMCVLSSAGIHPFQFGPIPPVKVLVVDAENSEKQWRRAVRQMADTAALTGARDPRDGLALEVVSGKFDIVRPADLGDLHRMMDRIEPDLLMIGPLYKLVPRSIKDDDDAAPVLAALDSLRERGVAMLIEAHAGHAQSSGGERDLRPRGSSALLGWPEFGLGLRADKVVAKGPQGQPAQSLYSLQRWRGDRDQRPWPRKLTKGHRWPWEPAYQL